MTESEIRNVLASNPPRGLLRFLLRLPIWLYRWHLGFLLGHRFLLLTHTGCKSGLKRQTVVEVVSYDRATHRYVVASGWGKSSQWLQNVEAHPEVTIDSAGEHLEAAAVQLSPDQAHQELSTYARMHPLAFRELATLIMGSQQGTREEICARMAQVTPLIALQPRHTQL